MRLLASEAADHLARAHRATLEAEEVWDLGTVRVGYARDLGFCTEVECRDVPVADSDYCAAHGGAAGARNPLRDFYDEAETHELPAGDTVRPQSLDDTEPSMYATVNEHISSNGYTMTVVLYRDGADPERIREEAEYPHTTGASMQAAAEKHLAERGLAVASAWASDQHRSSRSLLVWRADVRPRNS